MSEIIDHVGITVSDFERSKDFYVAALGTLGIRMLTNFEHAGNKHAGFGTDKPTFWIGTSRNRPGQTHIGFAARSRAEVAAFYSVAMSTGGRDNGAPGLRAHYHPDYFAAFVFDPDGNNIEAVCHVET